MNDGLEIPVLHYEPPNIAICAELAHGFQLPTLMNPVNITLSSNLGLDVRNHNPTHTISIRLGQGILEFAFFLHRSGCCIYRDNHHYGKDML